MTPKQIRRISHAPDVENNIVFRAKNSTPMPDKPCLLNDYVEGTDFSPVGYLEGIYVAEAYRKHGIAGKLLDACETWAKSKGCTEFASDCELDNVQSLRFHLHTGFEEANRIICFTKKL